MKREENDVHTLMMRKSLLENRVMDGDVLQCMYILSNHIENMNN